VRSLRPSDPVFCIRPRAIREAAVHFRSCFPGRTLYAVKCNPHPFVVRALLESDIRDFDVASLPEIALVRELDTGAGLHFMHPVKERRAIREAYREFGVRHFVVDHAGELEKVFAETGGSGLIVFVRVATPKAPALYHLAAKFGAAPEDAAALAKEAARRDVAVGLTFHVGSQCLEPAAFRAAFQVLGEVVARSGVEPVCIDVGGGFPHRYPSVEAPPLEAFARAIYDGVRRLGLRRTPTLWAEPGRILVAAACSVVVQVRLRKGDQLYINDGVYGCFSELIDSHHELPARLLPQRGRPSGALRDFEVHGPTCDSMDILTSPLRLPDAVSEGDWIEVDQLGAYSNALSTHFNGFAVETFAEVFDEPPARTWPTGASSLR
jgi:ornithine decarboxylase